MGIAQQVQLRETGSQVVNLGKEKEKERDVLRTPIKPPLCTDLAKVQ